MTRSLQSMLIKASTLGLTFGVVSEGDALYMGKNPRDAYQVIRELDECTVQLLDFVMNGEGTITDWAFLTPGDADAYICDCMCNGFFDNWEI